MGKQAPKWTMETTRPKFVAMGLGVGLITGVVISAFRFSIEWGLRAMQGIYRSHLGPWQVAALVLVSLAVAVGIGLLLKSEPQISGSGIPQIEGQLQGELDFHWWSVLWKKFVAGILAIGSGLMLGREGPSIQLGAAVGQGVADTGHMTGPDRRVLIASGAAAGLAAAFNAPIAGTMFVLEEVYHNFSPLVWLTSLASAIGANFISLYVFGQTPVLHLAYQQSLPIGLYWHLLLLGIVLGLLALLYQQVLLAMPRVYALTRIPRAFQGVVPFLLIIPVGMYAPQILGGGNGLILSFGQSVPAVRVLALILLVRFLFSMVSYGSGLPGGIFLPILTLGAVIGALYGQSMVALGLLPAVFVPNLIIFAMAGYFAGIGKAPFTAILLITEMVGHLGHLMPLAVLSLTAYVVVDAFNGAPIYESLLERLSFDSKVARLHHADRLEVPIFVGSALAEHAVRDIAWPATTLVIGLNRGAKQLVPHGDTVIREGDTLVLLVDHAERFAVRQAMDKLAAMVPAD